MATLTIGWTWDGFPARADEVATVEVVAVGDVVTVRVDAPFHGDPAPAGPAGATPRLWEHEVVELFVLGDGTEPPEYTEVELGPHGHHLVLRLRGVRAVVESGLPLAYRATIAGGRWRGEARLPRAWLPPSPHRVNAYAIHGTGDARRYLAWRPAPGPRPDFHRLDVFGSVDLG